MRKGGVAVVGDGERDVLDAQALGDGPRCPREFQRGLSAGFTDNFDIEPTHAASPAGSESFHRGLFSGESSGEPLGAVAVLFAVGNLRGSEETLEKPASMAVHGRLDAIHFRDVHAQADDHCFSARAASAPSTAVKLYRFYGRAIARERVTLQWILGHTIRVARAIKIRSSRRNRRASDHSPPLVVGNGWTVREKLGLQILQSQALVELDWLVHGFSTRPGGTSILAGTPALNLGFTEWDEREHVAANRAKFTEVLSTREMPLLTLRQFHSDVICVAAGASAEASKADSLMTSTPGLLLAVQTADCVPILLADTRRRVVAAIHAGWRGTLARITVKALGRMQMEFGTRPRNVVAVLGPAIGRCCYEVGPEVGQAFAAQFPSAADWFDGPFEQLSHGEEPLWLPWLTMMPPGHVPPPPRVKLDLRASNRWQLIDAGVPERQIFASSLCTACRTDLLFSYRREGAQTGRLMTVIGIRV